MQIHELNNFAGTPSSTDYLAIDNSTTTTKIGATGLGVQDKLTVAEANTGTSTASRIVTPKVVHDYVTGEVSDGIDNITTSATETKWSAITGGDGSINDALNYTADKIAENTLGTSVNVSSYTSENRYTFPSDGYLIMVAADANKMMRGRVSAGSDETYYFDISAYGALGAWTPVFVKKGMKYRTIRKDDTNENALFVPLS